MSRRVLVARPDNLGDVLLAGPAVRAVAASGAHVTVLSSAAGEGAARLLPGVDDVVVHDLPWVGFDPPAVDPSAIDALVANLRSRAFDDALVLTSFHQSPLPLALLARLAGVGRVAATSVDYPGSLLDARVPYRPELHEVEQNLLVAGALGFVLPADDDGALHLRPLAADPAARDLVLVHPSASVPARGIPAERLDDIVSALVERGFGVGVTGTHLDHRVAATLAARHRGAVDLTGTADLADLASLLAAARVVVTGNTGPAHLAAAVGTPVVTVFAPVVDPRRWRPWMVPHRLLGDLDIACRGCRSRRCPLPGQPCLDPVTGEAVAAAVTELVGRPAAIEVRSA